MSAPLVARVVLLGASGYAGLEFLRLARRHDGIALVALASREAAGQPARALSPMLAEVPDAALPGVVTPEAALGALIDGTADTLVSALPHGALAELMQSEPAWLEAPRRIVDLSSDRRDGSLGFAYGLPEMNRSRLLGATRVANPGCYPTAATLAVLPAVEAGLADGPFTVTALSGVTGAGRKPALKTSFAELDGGAAFYQVGSVHAHVREMERNLTRSGADLTPRVAFAPQLVPMSRGILATVTATLARPMADAELRDLYAARYRAEPFVRLLAEGEWPATHAVRGTNRATVAVTAVHGGGTLMAVAAIDNLVKGAAGQAVQNLNLMTGHPEAAGLTEISPW
jgi:N-acetyl-gamma-glutamyl-phosphate reductase